MLKLYSYILDVPCFFAPFSMDFYPFVKTKNKNSEMSSGYVKVDTRRNEPTTIRLEKGEKYLKLSLLLNTCPQHPGVSNVLNET